MTRNYRLQRSILLAAFISLPTVSVADNYKHISETLSAADIESLDIEFSVGELEVIVGDGDSIELEIELKAERSWLSWRRRKVEDIDVEIETRGDTLYLAIEENNLSQQWSLRVPAKLALEAELGVGDIRIENLANDLDVELGVGSVEVTTADTNYDSINASVGVGDVSLRGFGQSSDNERSFVSADAYYQGQGDYSIEIDLGVGDVEVTSR